MGGSRGRAAVKSAYALATKQARAEAEPVPLETGKLRAQMAGYAQMRANPAKGRDYNPVAAADIKAPMIIVVAQKEELMDNAQNRGKVYEILKAKGDVPVAYHEIKGINSGGTTFSGTIRLLLRPVGVVVTSVP